MRNHRRAPARLALLGALAIVALGEMQGIHAIINGTLDGNLHPNVGMVVAEASGGKFTPCSGNLITPTVFVTAAHCLEFIASRGATQVWVSFDSHVNLDMSTLIPGTLHPNPAFRRTRAKPQRHHRDHVRDACGAEVTPPMSPTPGLLDGARTTEWTQGPVVHRCRLRGE